MALDRVQCGTCGEMMQPMWHPETGYCFLWRCLKCGRDGPAVGRERLITQKLWEAEHGKNDRR